MKMLPSFGRAALQRRMLFHFVCRRPTSRLGTVREVARMHGCLEPAVAAIAAARLADLWPLWVRALELEASCALRVQDVPGANWAFPRRRLCSYCRAFGV